MAHMTGDFSLQGKYSGSPVRIVLFKEKQLLFDSHSVEKTKADDNGNRSLYPYSKLTDEFCHLAEMIFGTTAMRYSGPYCKIHDVASCEKIVFTQVFSKPDRKSVNLKKSHESSLSNFGNRETSSCSSESSLSIFKRDADSSSTMDSGFSEISLTSSLNCSFNADNFSTSSCSSMDIHDSFNRISPRNSHSKLGIAIILAVAKERRRHNFYSNHITFVQSILHRLKQCIEYAILSPRYWLSRVLEISNDSTKRILESYTENGRGARRGYLGAIRDRLGWTRRSKGDEVFDRFCGVIQKIEVKEKNFFLSTLLTSILTHHPSWIASHRSPPHFHCTAFNSVWSRMRSVYGLLGPSRKSSRTLVFNPHDEDLIRDVMGFVKYFLRYFSVERWEVERDESGEEVSVDERVSLGRMKTCPDLVQLGCIEESEEEALDPDDPVVFILGEDEELVGLRKDRTEARVNVLTFPLPKMKLSNNLEIPPILLDSNFKHYTPDSPLQGTTLPRSVWMEKLHDELSSSNFYIGNEDVEEAVAIVADTERWEVKLVSSNRRSVYRTSPGETPDTSQLIADMLEATLEMWKAGIPKEFCITHIEQRLMEVCLKADALSYLLLTADFCTMSEILTNLDCAVSDIPLLMSVVSTVYPEVNRKYGLSYQ